MTIRDSDTRLRTLGPANLIHDTSPPGWLAWAMDL